MSVLDNFYGRDLYSATLMDWENVAREYIPHFMWYRDVNDHVFSDGEHENARYAWCSYCGCFNVFDKDPRLDIYMGYQDIARAKHGSYGECPCCNYPIRFINENRMTSYGSLQRVHRLVFSDFIDFDHVNLPR